MQEETTVGYRRLDDQYPDHPRHTGASVDPSFLEAQAKVESRYKLGRLEGELSAAEEAQDAEAIARISGVIEHIRSSFIDYDAQGNLIPLRAWPLGDDGTIDEVWSLEGRVAAAA